MSTLFVKKLTTLDFSYLCPERGLVGETWIVDLSLSGRLNEEGMLFDFGHVKKLLKVAVDEFADHKLLVPLLSSAVTCQEKEGTTSVSMNMADGEGISCKAPSQAISTLRVDRISPADVLPWLTAHVEQSVPENIESIMLNLYPETIDGAYYHYSHGLKKHKGNCQRIAHGHRSRLEIHVDGKRSPELEADQARLWKDIYIATAEDIRERFTRNGCSYIRFAYTAEQGDFEITLPERHCYIMETDTTVELLSEHVADIWKRKYSDRKIRSVLYEGVDKGASSTR